MLTFCAEIFLITLIILEISKKIQPNLSLGMLISVMLINKKRVYLFVNPIKMQNAIYLMLIGHQI